MSMLKRVVVLTLLLALAAFPVSALASPLSGGGKSGGVWSGILSIFGIGSPSSGNNGNNGNSSSYDKYFLQLKNKEKNKQNNKSPKPDKHDFWDWLKDNDWWEEFCWWTDHQGDSRKLWEKYFCY